MITKFKLELGRHLIIAVVLYHILIYNLLPNVQLLNDYIKFNGIHPVSLIKNYREIRKHI